MGSLIVKARHGGADYIFSLLSGYCEAPAGKAMLPGLYYNPYFAGGAIGMPAPLMDEQVEYPDGTPATVSQMAKDVAVFLAWVAEPEHDEQEGRLPVDHGLRYCGFSGGLHEALPLGEPQGAQDHVPVLSVSVPPPPDV